MNGKTKDGSPVLEKKSPALEEESCGAHWSDLKSTTYERRLCETWKASTCIQQM